jgi:hypothetical protein
MKNSNKVIFVRAIPNIKTIKKKEKKRNVQK